jgi:hypothetical protein
MKNLNMPRFSKKLEINITQKQKKVVEDILKDDNSLSDSDKTRLNDFLTDLGGHSVNS